MCKMWVMMKGGGVDGCNIMTKNIIIKNKKNTEDINMNF